MTIFSRSQTALPPRILGYRIGERIYAPEDVIIVCQPSPASAPEPPAGPPRHVVVLTRPDGTQGLSHASLMTAGEAEAEAGWWRRGNLGADVREVR